MERLLRALYEKTRREVEGYGKFWHSSTKDVVNDVYVDTYNYFDIYKITCRIDYGNKTISYRYEDFHSGEIFNCAYEISYNIGI